jgi:copper chaperone CopZ
LTFHRTGRFTLGSEHAIDAGAQIHRSETLSNVTYTVTGMTCGRCVDAVTQEVTALSGVRQVRVDLASGGVTVTSDALLPTDDVRAAVTDAGYDLVNPMRPVRASRGATV